MPCPPALPGACARHCGGTNLCNIRLIALRDDDSVFDVLVGGPGSGVTRGGQHTSRAKSEPGRTGFVPVRAGSGALESLKLDVLAFRPLLQHSDTELGYPVAPLRHDGQASKYHVMICSPNEVRLQASRSRLPVE